MEDGDGGITKLLISDFGLASDGLVISLYLILVSLTLVPCRACEDEE